MEQEKDIIKFKNYIIRTDSLNYIVCKRTKSDNPKNKYQNLTYHTKLSWALEEIRERLLKEHIESTTLEKAIAQVIKIDEEFLNELKKYDKTR